MAPILFALALLAQDGAPAAAAPEDGPMATQTARKQDVAPLPIQGGPVAPPTDDYGYVGWCYGAVGGYVDLYEKAMPEVIRIERAWPTPSTEENIREVYPAQKKAAVASLALYRRAIEAAEKSSPTPIAPQGAAAIKKGRGVWTGATSVPKAQLAQFWMSWTPPARCDEVATALEKKSLLFGQALTYNAEAGAAPLEAAPPPEAPAPAAAEPVESAAAVEEAAGPTPAETPGEAAPETTDAAPPADVEAMDGGPTEDEAAAPAMDPATAEAVDPETTAAPSAIDDLLPAAEPAEAVAPAPEPEAAPVESQPAPAAKPKPRPAAPKKKPGLRETLKGMRGPV